MKIKELLEGLTFKGYPCTSDCSGHQAGWEYAVHWGLEPDECPYGSSNSFWEGCKSRGEEEQEIEESHYTTAVIEDAVGDLEKDLQHPHSYDAIDHMMQTIAREQDITPKQLHDLFVKKHKMTPDEWIKNKKSVNENFADGRVKGKSRPGRVKRAGASCSGSVTSLRQKAKNSGGERAKMYHWCANMKSGRKK
jgi:hypothetical protein